MCFSATANFIGGGVIAGVGVATLTHVPRPRELALAALPLSFGVHQLFEGFVWRDLETVRELSIASSEAAAFYLAYAQALLPLLGPLAVLLAVPPARRRWIWPFLVIGLGVAGYVSWTLAVYDPTVTIAGNSLNYRNPGLDNLAIAAAYVAVTVGPFLVSGQRFLVTFGALNLVGLLTVLAVQAYAFTSIWCAYAAVVSLVLYGRYRFGPAPVR